MIFVPQETYLAQAVMELESHLNEKQLEAVRAVLKEKIQWSYEAGVEEGKRKGFQSAITKLNEEVENI